MNHTRHNYAEALAHEQGVGVAEIKGRFDADGSQALDHAPGDAPEIRELHAAKGRFLSRWCEQQRHAT